MGCGVMILGVWCSDLGLIKHKSVTAAYVVVIEDSYDFSRTLVFTCHFAQIRIYKREKNDAVY